MVAHAASHPPMLTARPVAAELGTSREWVYEQIRAGRLPAVTLGAGTHGRARVLRIRRSDLDAFIQANETGDTAAA
jgi:excisionase family DNA binding protein